MTNKLPKPNNSTLKWVALCFALLALILIGFQQGTAQENPSADTQGKPLQAKKPAVNDPAAAKMAAQALETLQDARKRIEGYDSLKADLLETVLIGPRRFQAKGSYLHARGNKVRQEFRLTLKGADGKPLTGSLLEVSDGSVMHSSRQIGDQQQITRRDVNDIFTAIEKYPSIDAELLQAKLGIGGLPALLASLERSFQFTEYKQETIQDSQYIMIGGGWKKSYLKRMRPKDAEEDVELPPFIPDYVRVFFDENSLFPRRIFYYKKFDNKLHPMLTLDLLNVQQNVPLGADDFKYYKPTEVVPADITQEMIDRIIQSFQNQQQRDQTPPPADAVPEKDAASPPK